MAADSSPSHKQPGPAGTVLIVFPGGARGLSNAELPPHKPTDYSLSPGTPFAGERR